MEDNAIVRLYWNRDEDAIRQTQGKYSRYLTTIAKHLLANEEDAWEVLNDTYLRAWNSIPPNRPAVLSTYLGKITRELAIDRLRRKNSVKRAGGEYACSLSELAECVSGGDFTLEQAEERRLIESINAWLGSVSPEARTMFIGRYFYADSLREIARYHGVSESKVKSTLFRARKHLKAYLEHEGFSL